MSITKRLLLDYIKYKTNNNYTFFVENDKIAKARGLTVNSVKEQVNKLVRECYLVKSTDTHSHRMLNLSAPCLTTSCVD